MPIGPFFNSDPILLTLAAKYGSATFDPSLDAVFQLHLNPQDPISLRSSLGLQAQSFALFPVFLFRNRALSSIQQLFSSPRIDEYSGNYCRLVYQVSSNFQVTHEIWIPYSYELLQRFSILNSGTEFEEIGLQLLSDLTPLGESLDLTPITRRFKSFFKGRTGQVFIGLRMDGINRPILSPLPGLQCSQTIQAGESALITHRCSLASDNEELIQRVQQAFPARWDAEIARGRLSQSAKGITLQTGNTAWDLTWRSVQQQAELLLLPGSEPALPRFSRQRSPSLSYPQLEPATYLNIPASALSLYQFCLALLPTDPQNCSKVLQNYLNHLRLRKEMGGQLADLLTFPVLVSLVRRVFNQVQERSLIRENYPLLKDLTLAWFDASQDKDQDGLPEWPNSAIPELNGLALFDVLSPQALPARITFVEHIALAILLKRELNALQGIAQLEGDQPAESLIQALRKRLSSALEAWLVQQPASAWRDYQTHQSNKLQLLFEGTPLADLPLNIKLSAPARLTLQVEAAGSSPPELRLIGLNQNGQKVEEVIQPAEHQRLFNFSLACSKETYQEIHKAVIKGPSCKIKLYVPDLDFPDLSLLLAWQPENQDEAWAGWLDGTLSSARFGLPLMLQDQSGSGESGRVSLAWNSLIIERLIEVGRKDLAFNLFSRLLDAVSLHLKQDHLIYASFNSANGQVQGVRNSLAGLLPLDLLLEIAGLRIHSPFKVSILGDNGIPFKVTFKLQNLTVTREGRNTTILMPDGTTHHHFGSTPQVFSTE